MFFGIGVGTLLYNEQAAIARVRSRTPRRAPRTTARIDLAINVLTIALQLGLTRWLLVRFGVAPALLLPAIDDARRLRAARVLAVAAAGRDRAGRHARRRIRLRQAGRGKHVHPRRPRDALQGEGIIDTVVYRGGDLTFVWLHKGLPCWVGSHVVFAVGVAALAMAFVPGGIVAWLLRCCRGHGEAMPAGARAGRDDRSDANY